MRKTLFINAQKVYNRNKQGVIDNMNNLKAIRKSLGITQIDAAKLLNISRRTYQKYESIKTDDSKLDYYINILNSHFLIDEEHGLLKIEDIKGCVEKVFKNYDINFCYLFGSYAKNNATPLSDVHLLIDSEVTGLDYFGLVEDLRQGLHKKVDLIKLSQLENNFALINEILKDGIKIYG